MSSMLIQVRSWTFFGFVVYDEPFIRPPSATRIGGVRSEWTSSYCL